MFIPAWRRIAATACLLMGVGGAVQFKLHFGLVGPDSIVRLGQPLPPLPVVSSGAEIDLRQMVAGRRSVVVFYSPACRACAEELPSLRPFPETLRLIIVSESSVQRPSELSLFPGTVPCYDRWGILKHSFATAVLPTILLVDERGILRDGLIGARPRELVQTKLKAFASGFH